jgi:tetratricopeptide (TPR) repeat protein
MLAVWLVLSCPALSAFDGSTRSAIRPGGPGMPASNSSFLVECYERFLKNHDIESFRTTVTARYTEGTLSRLISSTDPLARRAAILTLGLTGTFQCNASVAKGLKDEDPTVRSLASNALWAIWSRADTPENNAALDDVQRLIESGRFDDSVKKANALVLKAPTFAEAYNQRAIAHYMMGRLAESAEDCRKVLELNPYHFGALGGLGQCQLRLRQRKDAIRTFRRALELQPFSDGLRETVAELEAAED